VPLAEEDVTRVAVGLRVLRVDLDGPPEAGFGGGKDPLAAEDVAEVVVGHAKVRVDPGGPPVAVGGAGKVSLTVEDDAQVEVGQGIIGSDRDTILVGRDGLVEPARSRAMPSMRWAEA
jgi:hypothetical protein